MRVFQQRRTTGQPPFFESRTDGPAVFRRIHPQHTSLGDALEERAMLSFSDAAAPEAPGDPRPLASYGSFETSSATPSDDERESLDTVSGIDGASSDGEPDDSDDGDDRPRRAHVSGARVSTNGTMLLPLLAASMLVMFVSRGAQR